ncbi:MAG: hypothetical protein RMJ00_07150 [Nitrososphaerota archaeon]|nr:hypothetical protein [Candidatus Bathyarchaeota archaeon]MCX8162028.1 hypothetical protein [Candidatus Bathyarchaeota archaeon]MDW8062457.1 hypothetical protein [Nitrososphaerota archaeon]
MVNVTLKDDRLRLRGILDRVDECYPVEFKSSGWDAYHHRIQAAYIYYAKAVRLIRVPLTGRLRFEALSLVDEVRGMLKDDRVPAKNLCIPGFYPVHPVCSTLA